MHSLAFLQKQERGFTNRKTRLGYLNKLYSPQDVLQHKKMRTLKQSHPLVVDTRGRAKGMERLPAYHAADVEKIRCNGIYGDPADSGNLRHTIHSLTTKIDRKVKSL